MLTFQEHDGINNDVWEHEIGVRLAQLRNHKPMRVTTEVHDACDNLRHRFTWDFQVVCSVQLKTTSP